MTDKIAMHPEHVEILSSGDITDALKNEHEIGKDVDGKPITFSERYG